MSSAAAERPPHPGHRNSHSAATAVSTSHPAVSSFPLSPPFLPPTATSSSQPLLRFHPPTSSPHLRLHPDHLTVSHTGPGHHTQDHSLLHTQLPITFPARHRQHDYDEDDGDGQQADDDMTQQQQEEEQQEDGGDEEEQQADDAAEEEDDDVSVFYFEVSLLDAGKKGELFVGLMTAESSAADPQLIAELSSAEAKARGRTRGDAVTRVSLSSLTSAAPSALPAFSSPSSLLPSSSSSSAASSAASGALAPSASAYCTSSQRQLGFEHPQSVAVQLTTGKLFSLQLPKGVTFLPPFAAGDTIGIGYVHAALTAAPPAASAASSSSSTAGLLSSSSSSLFSPSPLSSLSSSSSSSAFSSPSVAASALTTSSYLFFTKNGRLLPEKEVSMDHAHCAPLPSSVSPLSSLLFPALSFHSPGESVVANFGQHPFLFDLPAWRAEARERTARLRAEVECDKAVMLPLIRDYLLWHGYDGTLRVLEESEGAEQDVRGRWTGGAEGGGAAAADIAGSAEDEAVRRSLAVRGEIRQLIQSSKVEDAMRRLQQLYPAVLRLPTVRFHLQALQFINILTDPHSPPPSSSSSSSSPAVSSSVLRALAYARDVLMANPGSLQSPVLLRLMGMLAQAEGGWSECAMAGMDWREEVADLVNERIIRQERWRSRTVRPPAAAEEKKAGAEEQRGNGSTTARSSSGSQDAHENGGSSRKAGKREADASSSSSRMDIEGQEVATRGHEQEETEEQQDAEPDDDEAATGSVVELVLAHLLALDAVWNSQRPSLPYERHAATAELCQTSNALGSSSSRDCRLQPCCINILILHPIDVVLIDASGSLSWTAADRSRNQHTVPAAS